MAVLQLAQIDNISIQKTEFRAEQTGRFMSKMIKEYSGIDGLDGTLIKTISDFSFKLAMGQLDDAAKVIFSIIQKFIIDL